LLGNHAEQQRPKNRPLCGICRTSRMPKYSRQVLTSSSQSNIESKFHHKPSWVKASPEDCKCAKFIYFTRITLTVGDSNAARKLRNHRRDGRWAGNSSPLHPLTETSRLTKISFDQIYITRNDFSEPPTNHLLSEAHHTLRGLCWKKLVLKRSSQILPFGSASGYN